MFNQKLKNLRTKYALTQEDLALETNISKEEIILYELGELKPDINTLLVLADYFEVSLDFILGRKLEKYKDNDKKLVGVEFFIEAFKLQKLKKIILRLCLLVPIVNFFYINKMVLYFNNLTNIEHYNNYMIQRHFSNLCFYLNLLILSFSFIYMSKDRLKEVMPFLKKLTKKKYNDDVFDNELFSFSFFLLSLVYIFRVYYHILWISKYLK